VIERVCVVGAGTIGSLCAAHLSRVAEVAVLARRPEQAAAIERDGLRISGKSEFVARLHATDDPAQLPPADLVIIATKAHAVDAAAARLAGRFPGAAVMTIQNGLGTEEVVRRHGDWPIVSAVTFMSGTRRSDAHVEYELDTATWMGPYAGTGTPFELVQEIDELFRRSGLHSEALRDLLPAQWSKVIFNATVNAVAALTDLPHNRLFAERNDPADLGHLVHGLVEEGKRIAAAAGVRLRDDPWEMNVRAVTRGETGMSDYAHVPSMLEDVRHRQRTEVDFISGALVREAERCGVEAPLHTALWRLVRALERSWELSPAQESS
jgi:2-dehydropantoate 2-reductase